MSDILSEALSEAGLDEFLVADEGEGESNQAGTGGTCLQQPAHEDNILMDEQMVVAGSSMVVAGEEIVETETFTNGNTHNGTATQIQKNYNQYSQYPQQAHTVNRLQNGVALTRGVSVPRGRGTVVATRRIVRIARGSYPNVSSTSLASIPATAFTGSVSPSTSVGEFLDGSNRRRIIRIRRGGIPISSDRGRGSSLAANQAIMKTTAANQRQQVIYMQRAVNQNSTGQLGRSASASNFVSMAAAGQRKYVRAAGGGYHQNISYMHRNASIPSTSSAGLSNSRPILTPLRIQGHNHLNDNLQTDADYERALNEIARDASQSSPSFSLPNSPYSPRSSLPRSNSQRPSFYTQLQSPLADQQLYIDTARSPLNLKSGPNSRGSSAAPSPPMSVSRSQRAKDELRAAMAQAKERRELEEEEENLGYAETYSEYRPAKLRSGLAHPDSVVESASLSSVAPPEVWYNLTLPEELIDTGAVSALQLEAVIYACQAHERFLPSGERMGYLIGDGAGVGKGRTIAAIIYENYLLMRKRAIWLSVSNDLKFDSERDLRDVGAGKITVYPLNKLKYSKIAGRENGYIKKGVIFATYSSLIGQAKSGSGKKYRSRLRQLIQWFGLDYDGVIVLDECHRAKNLVPSGGKSTKTGQMVVELQRALPKARVVYASATGATEPRNMAYMTRIGLWGVGQSFRDFNAFIDAVERRGVGAMEIVAMDMKQRGLYLARQLSFRGVSFRVKEVALTEEFIRMYDESVKLWMECRRQFQLVLKQHEEEDRPEGKRVWAQFWASHQRFFKYLCIAAKVDTCVTMVRDAIRDNKCVVIGLQSTGEARTLEALEDLGGELTDFISTAKAVLQSLIEKNFPTEKNDLDIFRDFDKIYDDFDGYARRRKRRFEGGILDELGLFTDMKNGGEPSAKIMKGSVGESSDDSDPDNESDSESSEEINIGDDEDEWRRRLLAEVESSSEDESECANGGEADSDAEVNERKQAGQEEAQDDEDEDAEDNNEDEFNPFECDFSTHDPWANKQQVVEDSPKKKKQKKGDDEVELEKKREKEERRAKKRQKRRERRQEEERQRRLRLAEATKDTAVEFMSSSRLNGEMEPEDVNPAMVKVELLAAIEKLGPLLPPNTLDQLIDELGGPEFVSEMTGRRGHMVATESGQIVYERRNVTAEVQTELMNMEEKDKFMRGDKLIAIISEAASSGISLQSDRRALNQRRRVHITLELPWSADKAIQQFGRTHRSNQVSAPEYVFLISELAGEKRFASVVAKRLESLGALTHGDRRATETRDLSQFNMDTKYGRQALDILLRTVVGTLSPPLIDPPADYKPGDFFEDLKLYMEGVGLLSKNATGGWTIEKEAANIPKFLNRILGLPVHAQNALFTYFTEIVAELIAQAKHDGTYDMGIMDLGTGGDSVKKLESRVFLGRADNSSYRVEMHKLAVERGVTWEEAFSIYKQHNTGEDGFYVCTPSMSTKKVATLVYGIGKTRIDNGERLYAVTRPSTGRSPKLISLNELLKKHKKITPDEAKDIWTAQYEGSGQSCQHQYVFNKCKTATKGGFCEVGRRTRIYFVLSGSVLSVWPVVEAVLNGNDVKASRMQVIRVRTEDDLKIVGLLILPQYVRTLVAELEKSCGHHYVQQEKKRIYSTIE
ncbi:hypothetical protein WR25_06227 isoform A [Diploscapter pachys]|uniref:Strawberry notch AAA domain-containing protein n=2 Tax=Diploscapter pachys TaxID=2018661 RepID=A0A2A2M0C1_9BILA|nr:hypothetical protein WR25_06227 isoform A [Diploscapter pachys]